MGSTAAMDACEGSACRLFDGVARKDEHSCNEVGDEAQERDGEGPSADVDGERQAGTALEGLAVVGRLQRLCDSGGDECDEDDGVDGNDGHVGLVHLCGHEYGQEERELGKDGRADRQIHEQEMRLGADLYRLGCDDRDESSGVERHGDREQNDGGAWRALRDEFVPDERHERFYCQDDEEGRYE